MFGKLQQCIGKNVFIKFWKDGKIISYEGTLNKVVDYKYILLDKKNYLLFLAANGAIASITCDDEVIYETPYVNEVYEPINEDFEGELVRRELACFDDNYKVLRYESSKEYFLKRGKELLIKNIYIFPKWERFVEENIKSKFHIVKAVIDIVNKVQSGKGYFSALSEVLNDTFAFTVQEIEEINDIIFNFFASPSYDYEDFAVYMMQNKIIKKFEEKQNMKQLMNTQNVYVSLAN